MNTALILSNNKIFVKVFFRVVFYFLSFIFLLGDKSQTNEPYVRHKKNDLTVRTKLV